MRIGAVADPDVDPGLSAGRELADMARSVRSLRTPNATPVERIADRLDGRAATDAAAVAAAFEGLNRIVDGVGLPIGRAARRDQADLIKDLGLSSFPHADHGA